MNATKPTSKCTSVSPGRHRLLFSIVACLVLAAVAGGHTDDTSPKTAPAANFVQLIANVAQKAEPGGVRQTEAGGVRQTERNGVRQSAPEDVRRMAEAGAATVEPNRQAEPNAPATKVAGMSWGFLWFLGEPWFVVPWYAIGALGALWVLYDMRVHNSVIKPAIGWGWLVIVFFFSVIGLVLYFITARAPGIGKIDDSEEKQQRHNEYEQSSLRRVNGAVIHCVAGDGFGIMTGMVIARAGGFSFWEEFWFEYLVGYVIGWIIFQRKSMEMMSDRLPMQLAMAFRGEFFSMLTVMAGMGAVMTYVTPQVATAQPKPLTFAFWGFGMLGLLVGYVFTFPMNWMMMKVGWKHGMGGMKGAKKKEVEGKPMRIGFITAMVVLGCLALLVPAWLTHVRENKSVAEAPTAEPTRAESPSAAAPSGPVLHEGIQASIKVALAGLEAGNRTQASLAMDAAMRAAEVGAHSSPGSFYSTLEQIHAARLALQQGNEQKSQKHLRSALKVLEPAADLTPPILNVKKYAGAKVLDPTGTVVGEVTGVSPDSMDVALGGWRDAWGFLDFGAKHRISVPTSEVAFGPPRQVGMTLVAIPASRSAAASE